MFNNKLVLLLFGATISAFFATACCLAPLLFIVFGISVSGLTLLTFLSPYSGYFTTISIVLILFVWIKYFYKNKKVKVCNSFSCKNHLLYLYIGTFLIIILNTYPYWVNYFI